MQKRYLNPSPVRAFHPASARYRFSTHLLAAAAKPARDAALGLGGSLLDLLVELVDGLEGLGPGVLCVGLSVALGPTGLPVNLCDLEDPMSSVKVRF